MVPAPAPNEDDRKRLIYDAAKAANARVRRNLAAQARKAGKDSSPSVEPKVKAEKKVKTEESPRSAV